MENKDEREWNQVQKRNENNFKGKMNRTGDDMVAWKIKIKNAFELKIPHWSIK